MYDALSEDYDRFVNWQERLAYELPFLEQVLNSIPTPEDRKPSLLDSACGTGMHTIALARRGYEVTGSDLSPKMIAQARQNAARAAVKVHFETVGFGEHTAMFGENRFDAVFCLGNSLPHLLTQEDVSRALRDFFNLLRTPGVLLIQNRNFDRVLQTRQREMEPQSFREGDREWIFIRFYDFLTDGLIRFNFLTLFRQGNQPWEQKWQSSLLRPLIAAELDKLLREAGFSSIKLLGNLAGETFDPDLSPNLVGVAYKT
jgi:glycine/sarcosine N-methyltransferase